MRNSIKLFFALFFLSLAASAQKYSFKYLHSYDQFAVNSDGDNVYCLFLSGKTKTHAIYRKVLLSESLAPLDSVEYQIDGDPSLVASGANEFYTYHAFETKVEKTSMIQFLITDKKGNSVYQFQKTSLELATVFGKEVKVKNLVFNFIPDNDREIMLVEVAEANGRYYPRLVAWSFKDGSILWQADILSLGFIRTTQSEVIGLTKVEGASRISYILHIFDKVSGKRVSAPFARSASQRSVDVVGTNGTQLMIAGAEHQGNNKNSKLYMSMFDMQGKLLFDKIDTTDRMGKYRRHLLGSSFDKDGNLILIGEGYRLDATRVVVATAATVAIGVLLGGGVIASGGGSADNRIDFISSAVLSKETGNVKSYKNFPVGPWFDFSTFYSNGQQVLIGVKNKFLLYNVNEPDVPPSLFASLKIREQLLLTSFGPAVTYRDTGKSRIFIEMVGRDADGK